MSIEAVGWALNVSVEKPQIKLVLIGLANHASPQFDDARPAVATLARYASCSTRSVQRALKVLADDGWVEKTGVYLVDGRKDKAINVYRIVRERGDCESPREASGVTEEPDRGDRALSPEPSIEPSIEGEDASARGLKISGKPVKAQAWGRTVRILAEFKAQTGKGGAPVTGIGQPSENAKRIYGRVREHPEIDTLEEWAEIIRRTLSSRWWGDGDPSVGVVFGPRVFEDNMERSGEPVPRRNGAGRESASDLLEAMGR